MSKEYVVADKNSIGMDAYWYERSIPTLELAQREAQKYAPCWIIEYKKDSATKGLLPTGKSWKVVAI